MKLHFPALVCLPLLCLLTFSLSGCSKPAEKPTGASVPSETTETMSTSSTITGIAYNRKGGAVVQSNADAIHYWIEDLASWEPEQHGQPVTVTGTIEKRDDNPVFINSGNPNEVKQGIPVTDEVEYEKQKTRFWIRNPVITFETK